MTVPRCPAIREYGKHRGKVCGRPIVGFVLPGQGRCGYHCTIIERARARAVLAAVRDMWRHRGLVRDPEHRREDEQQPERNEEADRDRPFDVATFAGSTLDDG